MASADDDFVYLDYNATTPVDPRVVDTVREALENLWGNPSSPHRRGRAARAAVEAARERVAACLGVAPSEVIFTSGGSESDTWALRGVVSATGRHHVVTSAVEHPAVLETVRALERDGAVHATVVGVDRHGRVDPGDIAAALTPDTALVSLMLANNEVGTLQPVAEVAALCRRRGVLVHTDAAQAVGKIPVDADALGVDLVTVAGHKLYAPKGVGVLIVRRGVAIEPLIRGAGHEGGRRAGTENVPSIVGLGHACELAAADVGDEVGRLRRLRDDLERRLLEAVPASVRHGHPSERLPNTTSLAFPGVDANRLLARLADTVAASAGAACHTDAVHPSHVLTAMGVRPEVARSTIRLSLGRFSSETDVDAAVAQVTRAIAEVDRAGSGPPAME